MPPGLQPIIPVILSGGTGTRLWPVSREAHPKPFMLMPDGQSLLQKTYLRAQQTSGADRSITVTNRDYFFSSRDTLQQSVSDTSGCVFLLEKNGRNTAAAITMAALYAAEHLGGHALLLVLPSDHLVGQVEAFAEAVQQAAVLATQMLALSNARYTTTTEVYPDSPNATPTQCNLAQVTTVVTALDFALANKHPSC